MASTAMATADPVASGTETLKLVVPKGVKVKKPGGGATVSGKTVTLPLKPDNSTLDPVTGSGSLETDGTFQLKKGKKKANISGIKQTLGGTYAGGNMVWKIGKNTSTVADLSGGTVTRVGFGAKVEGIAMKVTKDGAKRLNKALGLKKKKKNGKKNKKRFKQGKSLGTKDVEAQPKTVTIKSGTSVSHGSTGFGKLAYTCPGPPNAVCYGKGMNPTPGTGVTASGGAVYNTLGGPITAPVIPGVSNIAPDGTSAGVVKTAGTITVKKTISALAYGGTCPQGATPPTFPVGNFIQFSGVTNDFTQKNVLVDLVLQSPNFGAVTPTLFGVGIPSGGLDLGSATVTSDPATHKIDMTNVAVRNQNSTQVGLINGTFGTGAAGCGITPKDAAIGDALFTVDLHLVTQ